MKILFAFYKANGPRARYEDKIISWWTKGPYSHVEIFVPETMKRYTSSGRAGGVVKRDIKSLLGYETKNDPIWDYLEIDLPDITLTRIERFYSLTKDDKYDWKAIYGFVLPFRDRTNRWICSEWCANVGKISGIEELWKLNPATLSPNKLYEILKDAKNVKVVK